MSINRYLLFFPVLALMFTACDQTGKTESDAQTNQSVQNGNQSISVLPESGSIEGDTITIHGKVLLFFGPDKEKATDDDREFLELTDRLTKALEAQTDIRKIYTSVSFIRIYNQATGKPMTVDRNSLGKRNGFLVTDGGQPPKMSNEGLSEEDCLMIIKSYFMLPS